MSVAMKAVLSIAAHHTAHALYAADAGHQFPRTVLVERFGSAALSQEQITLMPAEYQRCALVGPLAEARAQRELRITGPDKPCPIEVAALQKVGRASRDAHTAAAEWLGRRWPVVLQLAKQLITAGQIGPGDLR